MWNKKRNARNNNNSCRQGGRCHNNLTPRLLQHITASYSSVVMTWPTITVNTRLSALYVLHNSGKTWRDKPRHFLLQVFLKHAQRSVYGLKTVALLTCCLWFEELCLYGGVFDQVDLEIESIYKKVSKVSEATLKNDNNLTEKCLKWYWQTHYK